MKVHRIPSPLRAVIFDIDGTLYANPAWMREQNDLLIDRYARERGKTAEEARTVVKGAKILASPSGGESSLANALAYLGIPISVSVAWRRELLRPEDWLERDPALRSALAALSRSYRLLALTNNPSDIGRRSLEALGVDEFFPTVIGLEDTLASKPDPAPFRLALEALDMVPAQVLSVGDRFDVDLAVPLEMGMGAILVEGVEDVYRLPELLAAPQGRGPEAVEDAGARRGAAAGAPAAASADGNSAAAQAPAPGGNPAAAQAPSGGATSDALQGPPGQGKGEALGLLKILPTILVVALLALSLITWKDSGYERSLLDRATDRMDPATVLGAFHDAYPDRISAPAMDPDSGEWTISVDGAPFAWARGRLLPPESAQDWELYRPYVDSVYPWAIPDPRRFDQALIDRLNSIPLTQAEAPGTQGAFAAALYGGDDEDSVWKRQTRVSFLGRKVTVHALAAESLGRVDAEIRRAAAYSPAVKRFIAGIGEAGAYTWRTIKGQKELSFHSYGIALDILPAGHSRRGFYWQWESERSDDWATLPLEDRWSPPEEVIRAFEANGWVWGGKWLQYDTMHFEYRPELIILRSRLLPWYLSLKG